MESHTTHVFWVKNDEDLISEWEAALETVGTIEDVDASTTSVEPASELDKD